MITSKRSKSNCREGENVESFEIAVPDATGFLMLKTAVCSYREKPKDAYDIYYYYCRYSEESAAIRRMLASSIREPAVARTVEALKQCLRIRILSGLTWFLIT